MIDFIKWIGIIGIPIMILVYIFKGSFIKKDKLELHPIKKEPKIAFLLPARHEEKVIGELLKSIQRQTIKINNNDIFVIVEDKNDKTARVAKKYGARVLYRTTFVATKGNALDDGIKQILKKYHYDLYFIFDADNVLDKNYVEYMLKSYYAGYDIAVGYRNCKNGNDNVIAGASTLIFCLINTIINKRRKQNNKNIIISGTGFFIKGNWIERWGGYPFQTLTEDYEISLYAVNNGLKTDYVENAIYYDEQPTTYRQTLDQRRRWISGYFASTKLYLEKFKKNKKDMINIVPLIIILLVVVAYLLFQFILLFVRSNSIISSIVSVGVILLFIYFVLFFLTLFIFIKENDKLNMNKKMRVKVLFYHPIFLFGYVECAVSLLFNRNVSWVPIEHKVNVEDKFD